MLQINSQEGSRVVRIRIDFRNWIRIRISIDVHPLPTQSDPPANTAPHSACNPFGDAAGYETAYCDG